MVHSLIIEKNMGHLHLHPIIHLKIKCCDFNPKKRVLLVAPPIDLEVEFGVFDANIWVSMARFLVLRS
jgi:hypothetical protein